MKSLRVWLQLAFIGLTALDAQTLIDLRTQTKSVDFSSATSTKTSQTGTALPATCSVGATFFNTAAPAGQNLYGCTATNTWTLLGANLWFGGGTVNPGDCAEFNSAGNIVSAGGVCAPTTAVTMLNPFTAAGSLMEAAGPGRQSGASLCSDSGGNLTCPGGFSGHVTWPAGSGTNSRQILGPAGAFTSNFNYRWSDSVPTTATLMKIGTPTSSESSLGPAIPDTDYVTPSGAGTLQNKTLDGSNLFSSYLPWTQISTPGTPAAGYLRIYAKLGSGLCWLNSTGTETCAGQGIGDPGGTGMVVETSPGVTANRTIASGSSNITVTNGTGAGGNPTVDIASTVDFSGKATRPAQVGTIAAMPVTCSLGQFYFASDGVTGRQLQTCAAANTWTPVAYAQGAVNPVSCSIGEAYFNTSSPAGQNLFFCTATNMWTQMAGAISSAFGRTGVITAQNGDYSYSQISNAPSALPPKGAASGDLSGSYPDPVVTQVNGAAIPLGGVLKANSNHQIVPAAAGTDYAAPTSGVAILKGNGAGGFAAASAGSDYMGVTTPVEAAQMPALAGDCVTSAGSVSTTCSKTHGTAFAASATTDTTNAANISGGTLNAARLPGTAMQTNQSNTINAGTQDFHGAAHTLPEVTGMTGSMPASCTVGEVYFATDAIAGRNEFYCTEANVWTQQTGGGSVSSVFGRSGAVTPQSGDYTTAQVTESGNLYFSNARVLSAMSGLYQTPIAGAPGTWPSTWPWTSLSGAPTFYYQSLQQGGMALTQRPTLNFINGTNVAINCVDDSGSIRTDCTISATAGAGGYATIQSNGGALTPRSSMNFSTEFTAVDDAEQARTDISINTIAASKIGAGYVYSSLAGIPSTFQPPPPTTSTIGGVQSKDCTGTGAVGKINPDGTITCVSLGSGSSLSLSAGSGPPVGSCTASGSSLVEYIDTANLDVWWCANSVWKKNLSVTPSNSFILTGASQAASGVTPPAGGNVTQFFDSALNVPAAKDSNGNESQMVAQTTLAKLETRSCDMAYGDTSASSTLTNAQLGPQVGICFVPQAATVVEVDVRADGGTPNVIVGVDHAGTVNTLVSTALATAANGARACSKATAAAGIDGTICSATLQNTSILPGDYIQAVSGTADGTAKWMTAHVVYQISQ